MTLAWKRTCTFILTALATTTFFAPTAWAEEGEGVRWGVTPTLGFQLKNLDLDQTWVSTTGTREKGGIEASLPTFVAGVTVDAGRFSLAVRYEDVFEPTSARGDVPLTNTTYLEFFDPAPNPKVGTDVEREDLIVTLGFVPWDDKGLALFAGYLQGETILTPDEVVCPNATPSDFSTCAIDDQANVAYLTGFYVPGSSTYRQEYEEDGWFAGGSYSWIIGSGALTAAAAYADMDGRYKDNFGNAAPAPGATRLANLEGDSTGTSISLRWTQALTDTVSYYFDIRRQQYDLESKSRTVGAWRDAQVAEVDQKETMTGLTLGLNVAL